MAMAQKELKTMTSAMFAQYATKEELAELQKATMVTSADGSAGDLIPDITDAEIIKYVVYDAPFLTRMRSLGNVKPHSSKTVSTRVKKTGSQTSAIAETADIPSALASTWDKDTGNMTTYVTPINISLMAQKGSQDVLNLVEDETQDAILDHYATLNQDMIIGDGTNDTLTGLENTLVTNSDDLNGEPITSKKQIDALCTKVIRAGGSPTALLTTANVISQLEDILYPNVQVTPETDMAFGYRVTSYTAPNGQKIPIIVDQNVKDDTDEEMLFVLSERYLQLKQLMAPQVLPVPTAKLATSEVIASFDYFQIRGERFHGFLEGIGSGD